MKVKRFLSMLLCAALVFSLLPVTAQAAESELVVTHTAEGDLAAEITAALGGNLAEGYTKIKINIGDAALSGGYNSGDWKTLCDLTGTLPDVSVLELVYTAGDRAIPYKAMYETSWLNKLMLTNEGGTLTGIEECAFYGTGLTGTLTIPPSVTSIGNAAFYGCAGIAGLSLPEAGKLSIGSYAFSETGLTGTLTIPPSVSSIGNAAFYGCAEITGLSLPATGSLSIGESAFWGTGLTGTLTIPPSVTSIGYAAFSTVSGITGLSLPEAGKLSIGSYAFSETGLTGTLTIPPSVTSIGNATFIRCPEITSLSLPEAGSLSMGMEAFRHTGLTGTLTIPSSVTSIGRYAFNGCKGLEALVFRNAEAAPTMMPVITDQLLTAYYPAAAEAAYTAQSGLPANRASYNDATARLTHFHTGGVRGVIGEAAKTVTLDLPAATELTSLTPDIGFIGASVSPASGTAQDFSAGSRTYTVTPVSGSPVVYTVSIFLSPTVSGSNNLSGTVGGMGNIDVDADVSDSFPGMDIALTASIDTLTATASRTGDGTATFTFAAADLNTLAPGSYDILVSAAATAYNAAIASTNVGTLTVMVPSADAALSNLSISQGTLKPTFATGTYAYTASVAHGVSSVTVTPTARDTNATIKVNGMDVTSGSASGPISLNVGKNDITVGVIAQNTTVNQNYTITVTRTGSSGGGGGWSYTDATLSPAKVDFDKNGGKDITVTLKKGSHALQSLKNGPDTLEAGTDYLINGSTVVIKAVYLASFAEGEQLITFHMSGGVNPVLTITNLDKTNPDTGVKIQFEDVTADNWFVGGVMWALESGLMVGVSEKPMLFAPHGTTTRGMIVTILHRLENTPAAGSVNPFTDVAAGKWYFDAAIWGSGNNIVSGYGNGRFGPEDAVTREQMAVILMNYARLKGCDVSMRADLSGYTDAGSISGWAKEAMAWANAAGLIQGDSDKLMPKDSAERCQVAAMFQRFV